jgi:hypothetical protein
MSEQRGKHPARELLGQRAEAPADERIAICQGAEDVSVTSTVPTDVTLFFQTLEEFLHRRVIGVGDITVQEVCDQTNR